MKVSMEMELSAEGVDAAITELYELQALFRPACEQRTRTPIVEKVAPEEQEEHVLVPAADLFGGMTVETLAPDEKPQPMPTTSHVDHEVDSAGVIWDPAKHAGQPGKAKPKKMDGTWKARRGSKKAPTNAGGGVAMAEVDAVLGKLIAHGLTADDINGPVSQAVFKDLSKTSGGMEHVRASNDPAVNEKALNSLRAIAAARNIQL
jgi:hypothetical protein